MHQSAEQRRPPPPLGCYGGAHPPARGGSPPWRPRGSMRTPPLVTPLPPRQPPAPPALPTTAPPYQHAFSFNTCVKCALASETAAHAGGSDGFQSVHLTALHGRQAS